MRFPHGAVRAWGVAATLLSFTAACTTESGQPAQMAQWSAEARPALDIAATAPDGRILFEYPVAATRLSNGTIAIGDRTGAAVVFVDSVGRLLRTVGREGAGPGEFRSVTWLGQCGPDSVYVWDATLQRMTVIDSSGGVARQYPVPHASLVACSRTGVIALVSWPDFKTPFPGTEPPRPTAQLSGFDGNGSLIRTIADVPMFEGIPQPPLSKTTTVALSHDHVFIGTADSAYVDRYSTDGGLLAVVSVPTTSRRPSTAHFERAIDGILADVAQADVRRQLREPMLQQYPVPDLLPAYAAIFTDPEGLLWVETSFPGDSLTTLIAIGANGRAEAEVRVHPEIHLFEIGTDYLLGVYYEDSGEPHVALYSLERSPS